MGYLELLVQFYPKNTAWFINLPNFDIDPLNLHPSLRVFITYGKLSEQKVLRQGKS